MGRFSHNLYSAVLFTCAQITTANYELLHLIQDNFPELCPG